METTSSQRQHWVLNPLSHNGNSCTFFNILFNHGTAATLIYSTNFNCPFFFFFFPSGSLFLLLKTPVHPSKPNWNVTPSEIVLQRSSLFWASIAFYKHHILATTKLYHGSCYVCFLTRLPSLESLSLSYKILSSSPWPSSCTIINAQSMLGAISWTKTVLSWDEGLRLQG